MVAQGSTVRKERCTVPVPAWSGAACEQGGSGQQERAPLRDARPRVEGLDLLLHSSLTSTTSLIIYPLTHSPPQLPTRFQDPHNPPTHHHSCPQLPIQLRFLHTVSTILHITHALTTTVLITYSTHSLHHPPNHPASQLHHTHPLISLTILHNYPLTLISILSSLPIISHILMPIHFLIHQTS